MVITFGFNLILDNVLQIGHFMKIDLIRFNKNKKRVKKMDYLRFKANNAARAQSRQNHSPVLTSLV